MKSCYKCSKKNQICKWVELDFLEHKIQGLAISRLITIFTSGFFQLYECFLLSNLVHFEINTPTPSHKLDIFNFYNSTFIHLSAKGSA